MPAAPSKKRSYDSSGGRSQGSVQQGVRSATRAVPARTVPRAVPVRVVTRRRVRLNPAQKAHLIRFGDGAEKDIFQRGRSKRTSDALYGRGLLAILETNERTGFCTYVLTPDGEKMYEALMREGMNT